MISFAALLVVLMTGLYLVGLAAVAFFAPAHATRFLQAFAVSARAHYLELALRLVTGAAFLVRAPAMPFSPAFVTFGWILIITTVVLLLVPWQWHRRFAEKYVPRALRYLPAMAAASLILGVLIITAALG